MKLQKFFGLSGNELKIYAASVIIARFPPEFGLLTKKILEVGTRVKSNFDTIQNFLQISLILFIRVLENIKSFKFNITHSMKL